MNGDPLVGNEPTSFASEEALKALAEPTRLAIVRLVADEELPAGRIAESFDVSRPAVSQHLAVLKEAGLIAERRVGTRRFYRARPEGIAQVRSLLDSFWTAALDQARRLAEAEDGAAPTRFDIAN